MIAKRIRCALVALCSILCPGVVWGQATTSDAAADSIAKWTVTQKYIGKITGNVTQVGMSNGFSSIALFSNGWRSTVGLGISKTEYRLQDRRDESKNLNVNLLMPLRQGVVLSAVLADNRFFNRVVTFSSALQDFKNNAQQAQILGTYNRTLPYGGSLSTNAMVSASTSEQTFANDNTREASLGGGIVYNVGPRVTVKARAFEHETGQASETSGVRNTGLGGNEDSLSTSVKAQLIEGADIEMQYMRYTKTNEFMDLQRGVFQQQQFNQDLIREVETRNANIVRFIANTTPLPGVTLKLNGDHQENLSDFAIAKTRYSRTESNGIHADLGYQMGPAAARGTRIDISLENRETLHDLGSQSLGSYTDKQKNAKLSLAKPFSDTFSVTFQTGASILQSFYLDFQLNPRDRDQLDQYANVRLTSSPFPKIDANVYVSLSQTDYVSIDASLSQNNRTETTYDLRPEVIYKVNPHIQVKQTYGLNIEFSDFVFTEDENFLDRNISFTNTISTKLSPNLSTELFYSLLLHDRGSYLRDNPGAERLLNISQRDRRDQMQVSFRYAINSHLAMTGKNDFSRRRDRFVGTNTETVFTDGGIEMGIQGKYDFGQNRALNFNVRKVNRFGQFNTPEQEDYWMMDSSLNYQF